LVFVTGRIGKLAATIDKSGQRTTKKRAVIDLKREIVDQGGDGTSD